MTLDQFILEQWKRLEINQNEFARRLGKHDARVFQIRTGERSFPTEDFVAWCEILQLPAEDRLEFERLIYLSRAEKYVREWLENLEKIAEDQAKHIARQDAQIQELISQQRGLMAQIRQMEKPGISR